MGAQKEANRRGGRVFALAVAFVAGAGTALLFTNLNGRYLVTREGEAWRQIGVSLMNPTRHWDDMARRESGIPAAYSEREDAAVYALSRAVELDESDETSVRFYLAIALMKTDCAAAEAVLEEHLERSPESDRGRELLERLRSRGCEEALKGLPSM